MLVLVKSDECLGLVFMHQLCDKFLFALFALVVLVLCSRDVASASVASVDIATEVSCVALSTFEYVIGDDHVSYSVWYVPTSGDPLHVFSFNVLSPYSLRSLVTGQSDVVVGSVADLYPLQA